MKTTLNKIRAHSPCKGGWRKLLSNLGKTTADDEPLLITTILDSNGLDDALWCLRTVNWHQREMRLYAVDCARSVQHMMTDKRSIDALDVAERHAEGVATDQELASARDAARDAARASAWASAWDSAWASAWASAKASAWDAAWDSARASAWDSAWDSARASAWASARASARDSARASARDVQADLLRFVCTEIELEESK